LSLAPAIAADPVASAPTAAEDSKLPDLGTPSPSAAQTTVQPGPGSLTVNSRDTDSRFAATTETSKQTGAAVG